MKGSKANFRQNRLLTVKQQDKEYLKVAKKRRPTCKEIRKAIKKKLKYVSKNLTTIDLLIKKGASLESLSKKQYKTLLVVSEVHRQQQFMWENRKQRIEDMRSKFKSTSCPSNSERKSRN